MTPETQYARTTDGTHVAYQVHGAGPIDLLVLRAWHSNLDHEWNEPVLTGIYRRLGAVGRVIRLDRRGTGLSDRFDLASPPTLEHRIDDIRATLDAAGAERVVAVGLAHGGALCSFFAATYPERTAGLVLWSSPPSTLGRLDAAAYGLERDNIRANWATIEAARAIVRDFAPSRIRDAAFIEWVLDDMRASGTIDEALVQWRLVMETNVAGILPSIHVPTLVMWRSGGFSVGRDVAALIPSATAIELPDNDHVLMAGDWRTPLGEIERFAERVGGLEPENDRVLATVMFTDIVGSTDRAAGLGDRAWATLLEQHHAAVRRQLTRHRGREIDTAGDGFFASFDGPARAIRCAAAIREVLADLGLSVRIGLHSGECERVGTALRGVAVHLGARIGASAEPGEILVSSTVRDLVAGSGIGFVDAGRRELKGVPEPWQVFRVTDLANPDRSISDSD